MVSSRKYTSRYSNFLQNHISGYKKEQRQSFMERSVTIKDLAQAAGVSIATVSRVLNHQGNINEQLRLRVLQAASDLGYFKTAKAARLLATRGDRRSALKEIGFILTYDQEKEGPLSSFWAHMLQGAEIEARQSEMHITYYGISPHLSPYELLAQIHAMQLDGLLLVGPTRPEIVQAVQQAALPFVLVDNYQRIPGQQIDAVLSNNFEGCKEITSYLIKEGHRQIAFLGGYTAQPPAPPNHIYTFESRLEGYLAALHSAGLPIDDALIMHCNVNSRQHVAAACARLLATNATVSALVCVNDPTAAWALRALREQGYTIPDDISVVGFDDTEIAIHLTPPLTTMHVHQEEMGTQGVRTLIKRITHPQQVGLATILNVDLVLRDSVRPHHHTQA
jgi:DNA-binding LacI/PurR family transcriptional regulator